MVAHIEPGSGGHGTAAEGDLDAVRLPHRRRDVTHERVQVDLWRTWRIKDLILFLEIIHKPGLYSLKIPVQKQALNSLKIFGFKRCKKLVFRIKEAYVLLHKYFSFTSAGNIISTSMP